MTLPGVAGLTWHGRNNEQRGPSRAATRRTDARQGGGQGARRRRVWSYEPKWDGFRALVFRDGDEVVLQSRSGKELGRYFPELLDSLRDELAPRCVARRRGRGAPRDRRPHPAGLGVAEPTHPSRREPDHDARRADAGALHRVRRAGHRRPLAAGRSRSGCEREALADLVNEKQWCHVTRTTEDPELGTHWLTTFEGAGLDGVIAKRLDGRYLPGKREMVKVKHKRDADCVAIGYRDPQERGGRRVRPARPVPRRRRAADDRRRSVIQRQGPDQDAGRSRAAARRRPGQRRRARRGGTPPPTSAGFRCGRRRSPRWPTTRWRATPCTVGGSGTR